MGLRLLSTAHYGTCIQYIFVAFLYIMCVLARGAHMSHRKCGGQRTTSQIVLMFVLWNLRLSRLNTGCKCIYRWVISQVLILRLYSAQQMWWLMPITAVLGRLNQGVFQDFKASLKYRHLVLKSIKVRRAVVVHAFNSSTWETEASRSLWVQGQVSLVYLESSKTARTTQWDPISNKPNYTQVYLWMTVNKLFLRFVVFRYMSIICMNACVLCLVSEVAGRRYKTPWNCSFQQLWAAI